MRGHPKQWVHLIPGRVLRGASSVGAVLALALIAGCTLFAGSANASCWAPSSKKLVSLPRSQVFRTQTTQQQSSERTVAGDASIVGLWDIRFLTPDGELYDEGYDQFHSDGTEVLNDNAPPQPANGSGTVCLGVFESKGKGIYRVKHPFWIIDDQGNLSGSGVFLETIILDSNDTYHGSFTAISYDLYGNEASRDEGSLAAQRITVE